jgi:DNA polymerase III delta prime subunit
MSTITTAYHPEIDEKLNFFLKTGKIPNIIFHGASGSGKRTIVNKFIANIYQNNKTLIKNYVMYVNCAHGKGIKFVRDELKFFAKTHVSVEGAGNFKTIVLSNADELTIDAQSALRRCIELFSHTTRFFIIVQDKYKLLKPILSRLCEIFIYEPTINGKKVNLHKHNIQATFNLTEASDKKMYKWFDKVLQPLQQIEDKVQDQVQDKVQDQPKASIQDLMELANKLYEKGYSGLDLMKYIEQTKTTEDMKKYQMLLVFNKIKREFRNEKLFILFILNFLLLRSDYDLENISFM